MMRTLCCMVVALAAAPLALAAPGGQPLTDFEAGPVPDQLELDVTPIPVGLGALFVPSLTDGALEPPVTVMQGEQRVAWGDTGRRIVLPPGEYRVLVGHGDLRERAASTVTVREGQTAAVPVTWGALRVTAVGANREPVDVDYALRAVGREVVLGEGETATKAGYAETRTWLLPAGPVELSLDGDDGPDRVAVALFVAPGQVVRHRLVMRGEQLVRTEFATHAPVVEERLWRLRWIVGGDASWTHAEGRLGAFNGDFLRAGVFTRAQVGIDRGAHLALVDIDFDQSWLALTEGPDADLDVRKFDDELRLEALYNYRPGRLFGPYVRGSLRTALFETTHRASEGADFTVVATDGSESGGTLAPGDELTLFESFEPLDLRAAAGGAVTVVDNDTVTLTARGGAAVRRARYGGGLFLADQTPDRLTFVRLADDDSWGLEAHAELTVRAARSVSLGVEGMAYLPWDLIDEIDHPLLRLDGRLAFKVTSFLSVSCDVRLRREAYEIEDVQLSTYLSARVQHALF